VRQRKVDPYSSSVDLAVVARQSKELLAHAFNVASVREAGDQLLAPTERGCERLADDVSSFAA
jgi:hypothetical protein